MRLALLLLALAGCYPTAPNEWALLPGYGYAARVATGRSAVSLPVLGGVIVDFSSDHCTVVYERVHVQQVRRLGEARFVAEYARQQVTRGTRMNCLEIEAYTVDRQCMRTRGEDWPEGYSPVDCWLTDTERCGCD